MSLLLRHDPGAGGIELDRAGWTSLAGLADSLGISTKAVLAVVDADAKDKGRYQVEGGRIRAAQGHSVEVELGLEAAQPPEVLYHGTPRRALKSIMRTGLEKRQRHAVHLSGDVSTASVVGARRGDFVILEVASGEMHRGGQVFTQSSNGVWLTEDVAPRFITVLSGP
jgi:putative RNA 2'-phosphotransferase